MSVASADASVRLAEELGAALEGAGVACPPVGIVLGSGLGAFADALDDRLEIPFESLPSMARSTVPGHAGRFVVGRVDGAPVLCSQGRVHLYEGHSAEVVTRGARALCRLGVAELVLTNAAGGTEPSWPIPSLMRIVDHVNMQGASPSRARTSGVAYDAALGARIDAAAEAADVRLEHGVYAGLPGPSYETAAEIRMLTTLGVQAVGMSTVLEASAAAELGARVAAISCITNPAAGIASEPLDHGEVVAAGKLIARDFARLLEGVVRGAAG